MFECLIIHMSNEAITSNSVCVYPNLKCPVALNRHTSLMYALGDPNVNFPLHLRFLEQ